MQGLKFHAGYQLFKEGDRPDYVYIICDGTVEISRKRKGKKVVLGKLGKNSVFGEMALIDNKPRSATATTLTETECYVISKEDFEAKIKDLDPFWMGMFRILVTTIRNLDTKIAGE